MKKGYSIVIATFRLPKAFRGAFADVTIGRYLLQLSTAIVLKCRGIMVCRMSET